MDDTSAGPLIEKTAPSGSGGGGETPMSFNLMGLISRKVVWSVALIAMVLFAVDGFASFPLQTGAPQQAAVSAWGCFRLIAVYVIARGIDELTRGRQGV